MKTCSSATLVALAWFGITSLHADQVDWVQQAISPDPTIARAAQDHLRDTGPGGLQALMQAYAPEIAAHQKGSAADDSWKRIAAALNHVGGQYDEDACGLYWYTDFAKAQAAAQASGKPILTLRLLGRLDEDLSCANSRFFRATLYPNAQVNQLLRDKFILHWESVRPVPVVTIDFGDGRKLVRTITGNSIHYVLDPSGRIVDALPGLYDAATFVKELQASRAAALRMMEKDFSLVQYQEATRQRLLQAWKDDLAGTFNSNVDFSQTTEAGLETMTIEQRWQLLAQKHASEVAFDAQSSIVMARKFPSAETAAPLAISKRAVESPMLRALRNLQTTVALDTVRDNYLLRTKILAYLQSAPAQSLSLTQINNWIYANVFLTPKDDPWLGLAPEDVLSGIDQNGEKP